MTSPNAIGQNGHDKTPEEIQLEIARTRSAITEDLRVLSERFSPQQIKENAKEVIRDAREEARELMRDAKEVAFGGLIGMKNRAVETVTEQVGHLGVRAGELGEKARQAGGLTVNYMSNHALTLSLLGAGAGWLLMAIRNYRRAHRDEYAYRYENYGYPTDGGQRDALPAGRYPEPRYAEPRYAEPSYAEPSFAGPRYAEPRYGEFEPGTRGAGSLATRAADEAREQARHASRAVRSTASRIRETASDNRTAVVALTVVAGLGLGLLLPIGRRPRRALLGAGERVWDGAQSAARDVATRTRGVAQRAKERFTEPHQGELLSAPQEGELPRAPQDVAVLTAPRPTF
jgi:cell division septum initiation protein DivIVA